MAHTMNMSGDMEGQPPPARGQRFSLDMLKFQDIPTPTDFVNMVRRTLRPWTIFLNMSNFKTASSMTRLSNRVMRNLQYFQGNYIFVFIVLMIYCLITSPLILLVIGIVAYAAHKIRCTNTNVNVLGHDVSPKQQILALNVLAAPVLFLVGAGAVLFWTLGASCFLIGSHAIFYNIDSIVTEENEGFLAEVV